MPNPTGEEHTPRLPLRHRLPWNGLFWGLTGAILAGATFFGVSVQLERQNRVVEHQAAITSGDTVEVIGIFNGDEILVSKNQDRAVVRMLGIRAFDPVVNEREITAFGQGAVEFLKKFAMGRQVQLIFDQPVQDDRGRYLAYVEREGNPLNERMVEEGIAMVYTEFPFARETVMLTAERMARRAGRGVWGGRKAVARIMAYRQDWAAHRQKRTGVAPPDYLLSETP